MILTVFFEIQDSSLLSHSKFSKKMPSASVLTIQHSMESSRSTQHWPIIDHLQGHTGRYCYLEPTVTWEEPEILIQHSKTLAVG